MRKSSIILILSTLIHYLPGWNVVNAQTPPDFIGSLLYNPVLYYGIAGSWDQLGLLQPSVFIHDGTFYMYYTGVNGDGMTSIGLATSTDGYDYEKFQGNPVLTPSTNGFDAIAVSSANVIEDETGWIMFYGGRESGWAPPSSIGRATASDPTGPWTKSPDPVLTIGSPDEWDNGFISPFQVLPMDGGGYIMFYTGGDFSLEVNYQIGMATSPDGLVWTKYDDLSTTDPPFAESDPVLKVGDINNADWDCRLLWGGSVIHTPDGFEMYYSACDLDYVWGFGYATSPDGINWIKYPDNPIYTVDDDPYALENGITYIVRPHVVINGLTAFMYYDYGDPIGSVIGMATADLTGIGDQQAVSSRQSAVRCFPNPTGGIVNCQLSNVDCRRVGLKLYDVQGREVAVMFDGKIPAGENTVSYDMSALPAGIYFYRLRTDDWRLTTESGKIVKL